MFSNSVPFRATNSANLSMIFRSPVSVCSCATRQKKTIETNHSIFPIFRGIVAAILTFVGRSKFIDIPLPQARDDCRLLPFAKYKPFGAAGVSIFFSNLTSHTRAVSLFVVLFAQFRCSGLIAFAYVSQFFI